ncbi:MAG: hypothetical protein K2U26_14150 [Cyclobacteriaceae bacterium]|nr:hypothetical protein [Cyclobacteriaceae bacterium]
MMFWRKLGMIFCPDHQSDWMISHAANPFAISRDSGIYRIFFTCRDSQKRSHIAFVDIDFDNSFKVIAISTEPVIAPGEPGMFDDSGTAMGYYIEISGVPHIYYLGWNLKVTVPWLNTIGLARLNKESGMYEKLSRAPIIDRSNEDPFSVSYPSILYERNKFRMWYGSNLKWGKEQHEMHHVIKYAESTDGINWNRSHSVMIGLSSPFEYALSKPFVISENGRYKMWYSYRGQENISTYRIGYAESIDGFSWIRLDQQSGIDVSLDGWDSEMVCYPFVFDHGSIRYMLYNGNGYGKTGFGLAVLKR